MARTKDENYVLWLYRTAQESGDLESSFDRYAIGQKAGINPKAVNAICKLLIQANFIKKAGEEQVMLTKHGEQLAIRLLGEKEKGT
jgi:Mn-dependent DtxR family transcriptional regulator